MTLDLTNQERAQQTAADRAAAALANVDLAARCAALALPAPSPDGSLTIPIFDHEIRLVLPTFKILNPKSKIANLPDRLLALHYLLCESPVAPTSELITFRDLPGGNFYFGPFSNRSTRILTKRTANNLPLLTANLARFEHTRLPNLPADLAVRIRILGHVYVTLLYHLPDDESPATAELLFDASIKHIFPTEDVAALSTRLCLTLTQPPPPQ